MLGVATMFFIQTFAGTMLDEGEKVKPCSAPEAAQFDFWVGSWDLSWISAEGKQEKGMNRISKTFGSCVVKEEFTDAKGEFSGMSVSTYIPAAKKWKQTWVDNSGSYLDFAGEFKDGRMVLERTAKKNGKEFLQRMQWYNIAATSLDWNWERSDDNGKTWTVIWKIQYTKRGGGTQ